MLFWDLYGKAGHPVHTTISEIGPSLLGRILKINDTQVGMLQIAFKLADDQGLLLLDLDDLRALTRVRCGQSQGDLYPIWSGKHTVRGLRSNAPCCLWSGKAENPYFGEPALELNHLLRTNLSGRGIINILVGKPSSS